MKYYLLTDIEGVACVSNWSQTRDACDVNKAAAMRLLTREVNAAVEGILTADPQAHIHVYDGHGNMGIDPLELHPVTRLYLGRAADSYRGMDAGYDAVLFVGQHAMAGTPGGVLCHTYSSRNITYYKLNGNLIGEFGCRAALAGMLNLPVIFLSGDLQACREAENLIPGIVTAETKRGLDSTDQWSLSLSPAASQKLIRKKSIEAVRAMPAIKPYVMEGPYHLEIGIRDRNFHPFVRNLDMGRLKLEKLHDHAWLLTTDRLENLPL